MLFTRITIPKTCSCPFVQYFCTLFWDENIVYFLTEKKKPVLDRGPIIVKSSQNNVRKYRTKRHEVLLHAKNSPL